MKSQFHSICEAAAEAIRRSPGIPAGVAVVAYERGDIESEIERSISQLGLCVIVLPFEPGHSYPGTVPPFYDEADLIVHVVENPLMNSTGVDGTFLRDAVALALCGSDLEGLLADVLSEHRIQRADDGELTIREMTWKTAAQLQL
jgi:hypothetical protein